MTMVMALLENSDEQAPSVAQNHNEQAHNYRSIKIIREEEDTYEIVVSYLAVFQMSAHLL